MRRATALVLVALSVPALGACGTSRQDRARAQVCAARADIKKQVDGLKGMTVTTATTDDVSAALKTIRRDLSKIADAQGDLSDQRRRQVEDANKAFAGEVQGAIGDLARSGSATDARQQVQSSLQQLATAYTQAFERVDCSGT